MFHKLKWTWKQYQYRYHCLARKTCLKCGLYHRASIHTLKADMILMDAFTEIMKLASTITIED